MDPIINISFHNHPLSWKLIHRRLIHPSSSVNKSMCRHQTLTDLPKYQPKKISEAPYKIFYMEKMTTFPTGTPVDTTILQSGEFINKDSAFFNVTFILTTLKVEQHNGFR